MAAPSASSTTAAVARARAVLRSSAQHPVRTSGRRSVAGHVPPRFGEQLVSGGTNLYVIFYGHIAGGAGSAHATIEVSRDRGRTWSARTDPCGGSGEHEEDTSAVAAAGDYLAVLCVSRSGQGDTFTALSRDAGGTFTAGGPVPVSAAEQVAVSDEGAIAVGNGGISGGGKFDYELALSGDGGRTWRVAIRDREPVAEDLEAGSLQFVGPRNLSWVGYPYLVWQSSDAGHHWRTSAAPWRRCRPARRGVVHEGKILWPTRGPDVDGTIGSTMRSPLTGEAKGACK
jgi:hypothetical protein